MKAFRLVACLAAMIFSQSAVAATVENYNLRLRYEGTSYSGDSTYVLDESGDLLHEGDINSLENPWHLPILYEDLRPGDIVKFQASIYVPDLPYEMEELYSNGGYLRHCKLAGRDCTGAKYTEPGINFSYYDFYAVLGSDTPGDGFLVWEWLADTYSLEWGGSAYIWDRHTHFTVVEALAPVPLPASAALLPLGLGGLALLRRRRAPTAA